MPAPTRSIAFSDLTATTDGDGITRYAAASPKTAQWTPAEAATAEPDQVTEP